MASPLSAEVLEALGASDTDQELPAVSQVFLLRSMRMLYELARHAPAAVLADAAAAGSNTALVRAISDLVITESPAAEVWEAAMLRGRVALGEILEAAGGVWSTEEVVAHLAVTRQTLHQWRSSGRVLALPAAGNTFVYPVAQFIPAAADTSVPRPHPAIRWICALADGRMSPEELVAFMATPQEMLAGTDGHPVTPFASLAAGEEEAVRGVLEWVLTPADADAPPKGWHRQAAALDLTPEPASWRPMVQPADQVVPRATAEGTE